MGAVEACYDGEHNIDTNRTKHPSGSRSGGWDSTETIERTRVR